MFETFVTIKSEGKSVVWSDATFNFQPMRTAWRNRRDTVFGSLLITWKSMFEDYSVEKRLWSFLVRESSLVPRPSRVFDVAWGRGYARERPWVKPHKLDQGTSVNLSSLLSELARHKNCGDFPRTTIHVALGENGTCALGQVDGIMRTCASCAWVQCVHRFITE